ncbi:hypothetical protein PGTUg99_010439 [Puccinia graminis f. sp. tritici]|uniref:Uncharacterized protein n=1 Tax=Puccinia graminis f. sp. tritici TaxID=56615 RepID=A0A5B0S7K9_PUCGR|nr:hypothetical protein PGTUg99_010439 [Puccinia graminis f. sp. tritici]
MVFAFFSTATPHRPINTLPFGQRKPIWIVRKVAIEDSGHHTSANSGPLRYTTLFDP